MEYNEGMLTKKVLFYNIINYSGELSTNYYFFQQRNIGVFVLSRMHMLIFFVKEF